MVVTVGSRGSVVSGSSSVSQAAAANAKVNAAAIIFVLCRLRFFICPPFERHVPPYATGTLNGNSYPYRRVAKQSGDDYWAV
jgi:hypothetical protein